MRLLDCVENSSDRKTDKYDLGYIHTFYDHLFTPLQERANRMLEIGIYGGDSVRLWQNYFVNAEIYCVDINQCDEINALDRVVQFTENAYSDNFLGKIKDLAFDVIIDDGPHTFESMVFFLENYLPLLADDGVLVLEDIIDRAWTPKLLELIPSAYSVEVFDMRNRQLTDNLLNLWQNGLDVMVVRKT
jgi:predicted O-methyltransferase YrrM